MILAPILPNRRADLERLLQKMNLPEYAGMADPENALVPFGRFETIHFARLVILDDQTLIDFAALGLPVPRYPVTLAVLGDCDGPAEETLAALAADPMASAGLRQLFSHCEGFSAETDLLQWMISHETPPAAAYVNWIGRSVKQIRQENVLYGRLKSELTKYLSEDPSRKEDEVMAYNHLKQVVAENSSIMPTEPKQVPVSWLIENVLHFSIVPAALFAPWVLAFRWLTPLPWYFTSLLVLFSALSVITFLYLYNRANLSLAILSVPVLALVFWFMLLPAAVLPALFALLVFVVILRCHEKNEPEIIPRMPAKRMDRHVHKLAEREDHDVTNQFTVVGSVKPGLFRRWLSSVLLWLINYGARHIYNRGHIGRIQTIHFARWTFIDNKRRLIFASNYDGTLEAYMDDFINKVGWGLNLAFGGGVGYPRVNWLIANGSKEEQKFKYTLRRHQLPTEVWYKAYPGLTANDLARNSRIHDGIKKPNLSSTEIREWFSNF